MGRGSGRIHDDLGNGIGEGEWHIYAWPGALLNGPEALLGLAHPAPASTPGDSAQTWQIVAHVTVYPLSSLSASSGGRKWIAEPIEDALAWELAA